MFALQMGGRNNQPTHANPIYLILTYCFGISPLFLFPFCYVLDDIGRNLRRRLPSCRVRTAVQQAFFRAFLGSFFSTFDFSFFNADDQVWQDWQGWQDCEAHQTRPLLKRTTTAYVSSSSSSKNSRALSLPDKANVYMDSHYHSA